MLELVMSSVVLYAAARFAVRAELFPHFGRRARRTKHGRYGRASRHSRGRSRARCRCARGLLPLKTQRENAAAWFGCRPCFSFADDRSNVAAPNACGSRGSIHRHCTLTVGVRGSQRPCPAALTHLQQPPFRGRETPGASSIRGERLLRQRSRNSSAVHTLRRAQGLDSRKPLQSRAGGMAL
jgi:hypothetical protein